MTRTVTGLFDSPADAAAAVRALRAAAINDADISVVGSNADNSWDSYRSDTSDAAGGAEAGAGVGAVLGGAGGLLAGLGIMAIPGLGPVVAAGWLASTAVGAVTGAAVGGATGGILGALTDSGVPEQDAHVYAEGVRRGGTLVSARVDDSQVEAASAILRSNRAVDTTARGRAYRDSGWTGYDESAAPYTRDEVAAERQRYL